MSIIFGHNFPKSIYYLLVHNWDSPDSLFGKAKVRREYSFEEAQQVFQKVWDSGLGKAVEKAPVSNYETVQTQLTDQERKFLRQNCEHRTVRYGKLTFIAQLTLLHDQQTYEIDQLWFVPNHDKSHIILCVEFNTKEERKKFHEIARKLGFEDGRELLQSYANKLLDENTQ